MYKLLNRIFQTSYLPAENNYKACRRTVFRYLSPKLDSRTNYKARQLNGPQSSLLRHPATKFFVTPTTILGDPRAVSGGVKMSKRARKNSGAGKSRATRRAPGDKVLTDQFQTAGVVLASDWYHKTFVFCAQSQSSKTRSRFAYSYTIGCSPYVYSRRKVPITAKCRGDRLAYPQETRVS